MTRRPHPQPRPPGHSLPIVVTPGQRRSVRDVPLRRHDGLGHMAQSHVRVPPAAELLIVRTKRGRELGHVGVSLQSSERAHRFEHAGGDPSKHLPLRDRPQSGRVLRRQNLLDQQYSPARCRRQSVAPAHKRRGPRAFQRTLREDQRTRGYRDQPLTASMDRSTSDHPGGSRLVSTAPCGRPVTPRSRATDYSARLVVSQVSKQSSTRS